MEYTKRESPGLAPPAYSLFQDGRLVAFVWIGEAKDTKPQMLADDAHKQSSFATIKYFNQHSRSVLERILNESTTPENFLFKIGIEGFEVQDGEAQLGPQHYRF